MFWSPILHCSWLCLILSSILKLVSCSYWKLHSSRAFMREYIISPGYLDVWKCGNFIGSFSLEVIPQIQILGSGFWAFDHFISSQSSFGLILSFSLSLSLSPSFSHQCYTTLGSFYWDYPLLLKSQAGCVISAGNYT